MARTISEIQAEIITAKEADSTLGALTSTSRTAIWRLMTYIVAAAIWTLEKLFDLHKSEVQTIISEMKPHTLRWYVSKAKAFMFGHLLVEDTDYYDTSGMTDEAVEAARVVKFAAAVEQNAVVFIKIAGEASGAPAQLTADQHAAFTEYLNEVKDAGVAVQVINEAADHFRLSMDIYYNPMALNSEGLSLATGNKPVHEAIRSYIGNLPFNGEYRNVELTDALQRVDGVEIPELKLAETSTDGQTWTAVNAKATPHSGYYRIYDEASELNLNFIANV